MLFEALSSRDRAVGPIQGRVALIASGVDNVVRGTCPARPVLCIIDNEFARHVGVAQCRRIQRSTYLPERSKVSFVSKHRSLDRGSYTCRITWRADRFIVRSALNS
jgi:hypothetical protein